MTRSRFQAGLRLYGILAYLLLVGCAVAPSETRSLLGTRLERPVQDKATHAANTEALAAARQTYKREPSEASGIEVGHRLSDLGRIREAVFHYTGLLRRYPDSYRVRRHRGHSYILLRKFDKAEQDLAIAWGFSRRYSDQAVVSADTADMPTGTDQTNIVFHLGLAQYLQGDFPASLATWDMGLKVLGPEPLVATDDYRVGVSYWHRVTSARTEAKSGFPATMVREDDNVTINHAYHQLCLLLTGRLERKDFLTDADNPEEVATRLYGLSRWHAEQGCALESEVILEHIISKTPWTAIGHIAAEADLARH